MLQKIGRILKPVVPKFRPDLSVRLRDIAEKTGPREAETDSSYSTTHSWWYSSLQCQAK